MNHPPLSSKVGGNEIAECLTIFSLELCVANVSYNLYSPKLPSVTLSRIDNDNSTMSTLAFMVPRERFLLQTLEELLEKADGGRN